jgi:UDP-glucose 4-epimerase
VSGRRVLITGVSSLVGGELARRLERDPEVERVFGLDTRKPGVQLESTELIEADIRSPTIARLIPQTGADTVVHNQIIRRPGPGMSPRAMHDINVIGSLQLLAACEKSDSISTIVIRGSAGIYGSEPNAPQFFNETMSRLFPLRTRFQRDVAEIENYFETYSRRHPQVCCTMLRYQPSIGPSLDTQVSRYLSLPLVPTYLGFDPRLQLVHQHDALEALVAAVGRPVRGAVNVAGPGTIGLTRMIRLSGRPSVPVASPLFGSAVSAAKRLRLLDFSDDFQRLLRYGRAVEVTRLAEEVGYRPRYSTPEAVKDWAAKQGGRRLAPSLRRAVAVA